MNIYLYNIVHPGGFVAALIPKFDYVVQENNALGDALRFLDPVIRNVEDMTRTDVLDIDADTAFRLYILN